jgi:hypothetical protein
MYLLYADESGTTHDQNQQYFVLAGFCIFERQGYWISDQLDKIAARFDPADPLSDSRFFSIIQQRFDSEVDTPRSKDAGILNRIIVKTTARIISAFQVLP